MDRGLLLALGKLKKLAVWKMDPGQRADWADPHTKRSCNLCRAVAQGELRSPSAERVRALPWRGRLDHDHDKNIDGSCGVTDDQHAEPAANLNVAPSYYHGFDSEVMLAWRAEAETPRRREVSLPLPIPHGAADSDEVEAEWADGHRKAIPGLHVDRTRDLQPHQTSSRSSHGPIWQGTMVTTGHKVTVWSSRLHLCLSMRVFSAGSISYLIRFK